MMKLIRPAVVSVLGFTVFTGVVFPMVVFGAGQVLFPRQANGSLIERDGKLVGSSLIGQNFSKAEYFHPRPSAAGAGYDAGASSGSNLGPTSGKLLKGIKKLAVDYRKENGLAAGAPVPADAVTQSASGLDPDISVENATLQVARVAKARKLPVEAVQRAVEENSSGRQFGLLGEPRVNVVALNMALDAVH